MEKLSWVSLHIICLVFYDCEVIAVKHSPPTTWLWCVLLYFSSWVIVQHDEEFILCSHHGDYLHPWNAKDQKAGDMMQDWPQKNFQLCPRDWRCLARRSSKWLLLCGCLNQLTGRVSILERSWNSTSCYWKCKWCLTPCSSDPFIAVVPLGSPRLLRGLT